MGEASEAHYLAERSEHLRNADEELALGDGPLPPVLNKADSDLVDAVFNARIEALAALRRFTSAAASGMRHAWELSALLAADARLDEAERALKAAE